jgi:hypothetical protein
MTRVQRRPLKTERYFEWIESIFWLIPMGIVILGAATGALAFYLSSSLFSTGCARIAGVRRQKRLKINREQKAFRRIRMTAEIESSANDSKQSTALCILELPQSLRCNSPSMANRSGKSRHFRMGLIGCIPFRECKYAHTFTAPRFPEASAANRPRFNRF